MKNSRMKKGLKNVSFLILLFQMCISFGQSSSVEKRIVLDVGHGGIDSGALAKNGVAEKDIVLAVALEVLELNKNLKHPYSIFLTRYNDTLIALRDRTRLAKALHVDLFVSLHCNSAPQAEACGVEVYVGNQESVHSKTAIWLAYRLQNRFKKQFGQVSRGVKFANFQVLRETRDYCPAVLLELGFLSNPAENSFMATQKNISRMAALILNALKN